MKLDDMSVTQKCIFCVKVVEYLKNGVDNEMAVSYIDRALDLSKSWILNQENIATTLYNLIDNEDNGFTMFQELEEDEKKIMLWNCIIDAFAFICRKAYENIGTKYYPEPIELVDDDTLTHLTDSFMLYDDENSEVIKNILSMI